MNILFNTGWIYLRFTSEGIFEIQTRVHKYNRLTHEIEVYDRSSLDHIAVIKPPESDAEEDNKFRYITSDKQEKEVWICDPDLMWRQQALSLNDLQNPPLFSRGQRIRFVIFDRGNRKYSHYPLSRTIAFINPESSTINIEDNYSESGISSIRRISTTEKLERSCNLFILYVYNKGKLFSREYISILDPRDPLGKTILSCEEYDLWIIALQKRTRVDIHSPIACKMGKEDSSSKDDFWVRTYKSMWPK